MSCSIYGQEKVEYTLNVTDEYSAITADTTYWKIEDVLLDGSDNTDEYSDQAIDYKPTKEYQSKGDKSVTATFDFVDGWDNTFKHTTNISTTALVYDEPLMDFSWDPEEPTIKDDVTFTQLHDDTRDDTVPKSYGRIDSVDVDIYNDGELENEDLTEDDEFTYTFEEKQDGIEIKLAITYWDGWESINTEIVKVLDMSNIPPVSDSTREDSGVCIPNYTWTATSSDEDDDIDELTYSWTLSKKNDDDEWEEIDTGDEIEYSYPFQYEGDYKLSLVTSDDDGGSDEKIEEFSIVFDTCGTGDGLGSGTIVLQPNRFQMIAIPVAGVKVKEYFLDKIAEIVGDDASTVIELVKAYPSSDASEKKYQVFIPDLTNPDSSTNFELMQTDGDITEITAFYVKTKEFDGTIEYTWDSADGGD